ncbi:MAG: hypothetical protein R3A13_03095 [Bdellovibrionota bacterium]
MYSNNVYTGAEFETQFAILISKVLLLEKPGFQFKAEFRLEAEEWRRKQKHALSGQGNLKSVKLDWLEPTQEFRQLRVLTNQLRGVGVLNWLLLSPDFDEALKYLSNETFKRLDSEAQKLRFESILHLTEKIQGFPLGKLSEELPKDVYRWILNSHNPGLALTISQGVIDFKAKAKAKIEVFKIIIAAKKESSLLRVLMGYDLEARKQALKQIFAPFYYKDKSSKPDKTTSAAVKTSPEPRPDIPTPRLTEASLPNIPRTEKPPKVQAKPRIARPVPVKAATLNGNPTTSPPLPNLSIGSNGSLVVTYKHEKGPFPELNGAEPKMLYFPDDSLLEIEAEYVGKYFEVDNLAQKSARGLTLVTLRLKDESNNIFQRFYVWDLNGRHASGVSSITARIKKSD